jgi:hypothetical protein
MTDVRHPTWTAPPSLASRTGPLVGIGWAVHGDGLVVGLLAVLLLRPALRRAVGDWPAVRAVGRYPATPLAR